MSRVVVVTGSRDWRDIGVIHWALIRAQQEWPEEDMTLRHGCASGADAIARSHADFFCWKIEDYWPDYADDLSFAEANLQRNIQMLEDRPRPDLVLAFPTANSRGTWHTVREADKRGLRVWVHAD